MDLPNVYHLSYLFYLLLSAFEKPMARPSKCLEVRKVLYLLRQSNYYCKVHTPLETGFAWGTQSKFYILRWGNATFSVFRYQHVDISNAKLWRLGSKPT